MLLCLDIGNSHILGGVFADDGLLFNFRHATYTNITADQLGTFLINALQANQITSKQITEIAICSVVPSLDYSVLAACKKYFTIVPFILDSSVKTTIKVKTDNPAENGSDIIAGLIAATHNHPKKNLIVIDLGTVTTLAAINQNKEYLGATFIPGMQTAMLSLHTSAAKLFKVEIIKPQMALGSTTTTSIQSGLFWGHLGAIKETTFRITKEVFQKKVPLLIATGGFAQLFRDENIFTHIEPNLVLHGIKIAHYMNKKR